MANLFMSVVNSQTWKGRETLAVIERRWSNDSSKGNSIYLWTVCPGRQSSGGKSLNVVPGCTDAKWKMEKIFLWIAPLIACGLCVVPGSFLLFQSILILSHWFPGSQTSVCVHCCLLCKLCSHHQKESHGMKREKRGSTCYFILFLASCFRIFRMSINAKSAGSTLTHYCFNHAWLLLVIRGCVVIVWNRYLTLFKSVGQT